MNSLEMRMTNHSGRTYNQFHVPRSYGRGKRRFSVYWTWSYPWEANQDITELDNRFSTMTEVRRVGWPKFESVEYSENTFLQGIDQAGQRLPIDQRILADTDTLMVFGLDHMVTEQEASPEEIERDIRSRLLTRAIGCALQYALSPTWSSGYEPRQTTARTGPSISAIASQERYAVNSLGFSVNAAFPKHKANLGVKFFKEFRDRSTCQGYSVQFSGSINFERGI
jgi:hypothetical protein